MRRNLGYISTEKREADASVSMGIADLQDQYYYKKQSAWPVPKTINSVSFNPNTGSTEGTQY